MTNNDGTSAGDEVATAREEVVEAMATTAEMYGMKRSVGRLYGILYFADGPLSLDELVERSDYAKSTVSTAMTTLERYYFVQRRSLPGEGKRAFFEAERDWWSVMRRVLETEGQREVVTMTRALESAERQLGETNSEQATDSLERVRELQAYYRQIEQFVDLLTGLSSEELAAMAEMIETETELPSDDR
ncbi:GbsR/MarR family transcriptional regulator [Halovenus rubra]|uniref:GbsR/MarR family transcriptional regulator n=2 Tax=Halovenus rubra TaxID=869890 RepID=A0ACC7E407_9EURY|nr:transcriptional regulator [Halovenus rubra]